jgi:RimJ/RimL family protein N-acetyltransferase
MSSLTTAHLRLRPFAQADLDAYAAMCADAEVMRHIGIGGPVERDVAWRQMALFVGHWALRGYGMWALQERQSGRLVGRVGYLNPEGWPGNELGWLLGREFWGRGYAFEAASAALAWGQAEMGFSGLISLIRPANARSIALATRLGAVDGGPLEFMGATAQVYRHRD